MSIQTEKQMIEEMIQLFCTAKHGSDSLCTDCSELLNHAESQLDKCPFGDNKPVCRQCIIHCYAPEMREKITEVMRYSGPRMICRHPLSALRHLLHTFRRT